MSLVLDWRTLWILEDDAAMNDSIDKNRRCRTLEGPVLWQVILMPYQESGSNFWIHCN